MNTITACENVCRDFFWLKSLGPWVGPAIVGSATALLIAFVAYPWQKKKDRELQIHREKRIVYRECLGALNLYLEKVFVDGQDSEILKRKSVNSVCEFLFYASTITANSAKEYFNAIGDLQELSYPEEGEESEIWLRKLGIAKNARKNAVANFRLELMGGDENLSKEVVATFFEDNYE